MIPVRFSLKPFVYMMVATGLLVVGCTKKEEGQKGGSAVLTLEIPKAMQKSVTAMSTGTTCYAVNVRSASKDISEITGVPCTPPLGIFSGYTAAGGTLSLKVPKGTGRIVEVYALQLPNAGDTCPNMVIPIPTAQIGLTYHLGATVDVTLSKDEEEVAVSATMPAATQHIARQLGMSAACVSAGDGALSSSPTGLRAGNMAGDASGGTILLKARSGAFGNAKTAVGGTINLTRTN